MVPSDEREAQRRNILFYALARSPKAKRAGGPLSAARAASGAKQPEGLFGPECLRSRDDGQTRCCLVVVDTQIIRQELPVSAAAQSVSCRLRVMSSDAARRQPRRQNHYGNSSGIEPRPGPACKGRAESRRCSYIPSGFRFAQLAQSARPSPEGSVVGKPTSAQARKRTLSVLRAHQSVPVNGRACAQETKSPFR